MVYLFPALVFAFVIRSGAGMGGLRMNGWSPASAQGYGVWLYIIIDLMDAGFDEGVEAGI